MSDQEDIEKLAARLLIAAWGADSNGWDKETMRKVTRVSFEIAEIFMEVRKERRDERIANDPELNDLLEETSFLIERMRLLR